MILAGGLATRMRPATETIPKALLSVAGKPFADHQLRWLASDGVTDVVFAIGHLGGLIRDFVGDGAAWGLRVRYTDEGDRLRGTAGALRLAYDAELLENAFAVLYGDSFLSVDVGVAFAEFRRARRDVLMTVFRNDGACSNARLEGGSVVYDKTAADPAAVGMRYIDYGLSIIDRDAILPAVPPEAVMDLADLYRRLSLEGRVAGLEVTERFYEIGSPEGLAELEHRLAGPGGVS
ncbi:sugar phosphate nucleotidyltransferase [Candidatus Solirubrobacter pratensis]|uniref:sugar phosphate nucleotidyltransferase n=1 Tax=Candidatus Solirubrobacter pratensis TaxID=1298857 RepID=UPI00041D6E77|nr:sugar phosphate nucleotidyltransferase [Candidatus Solirubrobacter pratensis]